MLNFSKGTDDFKNDCNVFVRPQYVGLLFNIFAYHDKRNH